VGVLTAERKPGFSAHTKSIGWRNYRGQIAEIIVFNTALSDASCTAIDAYLATRWKVT
jgi:hypothetical protein